MTEIALPLCVALLLGLGAERLGLPPLVGYLLAGFGLGAAGVEATAALGVVADLGVLLLLFAIGLKLQVRTLARPAIWAGASLHLAGWVVVVTPLLLAAGALGVPLLAEVGLGEAALLAFALGFSSTVLAVKALDATGEGGSLAGRIALGTLVVQDVLAVGFLVAVGGVPSIWALPVMLAVVLLRPVWHRLLDTVGYGELLPLLGLVLALGVGAATFETVGIKPDLGALVAGMLLAGHPKAKDLAASLLELKEVLLVGFFLSIGLGGLPTPGTLVVVAVLLALLPLKSLGHLWLLPRFRLRTRTVWHTGVTLANYSEFGLIVVAVGVTEQLLSPEWATATALLVAVSFVASAPLNRQRYDLYARLHDRLARLERTPLADDDALLDPGDAQVLVFGMGRIGEGAYDELVAVTADRVTGVDRSPEVVDDHRAAGRRVVRGDALDADFWERIRLRQDITMAVLAMSEHRANLRATRRIRSYLPDVAIAAIASHPDEVEQLEAAGVTVARNLYEEAGQGLADDACRAVPALHVTRHPPS